MRRRETLIGLGSVAAGLTVGSFAYAQQSAAQATVSGLDISGDTIESNQPVNGLTFQVSGEYSYDATTTPTKGVLRLRVTVDNQTQQLEATELTTPLEPSQSDSFAFNDVSLLDHPELTAPGLTPDEEGETVTREIEVTVALEIFNDGSKLQTTEITDTATVEVTKTKASVDITISGSGSINIKTKAA